MPRLISEVLVSLFLGAFWTAVLVVFGLRGINILFVFTVLSLVGLAGLDYLFTRGFRTT